MRAVVERVCRAAVKVGREANSRESAGAIKAGLLVYAAAAPDDTEQDVAYIADKVAHLRVFPDQDDKMNLDVRQAGGSVLVVSAFSVHADARQGRRPSFDCCAPGPVAEPLVERLVAAIRGHGLTVETGRFAAYMRVAVVNDGPICILLDSRKTI